MKTKFNRNRNIIIFTICLLFVCIGNAKSQPEVPDPVVHLAFDTGQPEYESVESQREAFSGLKIVLGMLTEQFSSPVKELE